jgi:hypothetical protein
MLVDEKDTDKKSASRLDACLHDVKGRDVEWTRNKYKQGHDYFA